MEDILDDGAPAVTPPAVPPPEERVNPVDSAPSALAPPEERSLPVDSQPEIAMAPPEPRVLKPDSIPEHPHDPPVPEPGPQFPTLYTRPDAECTRADCGLKHKMWSGYRHLWQCPVCGYECWTPEEATRRRPGIQVA